ncbi:uncharacterized protein LOC111711710 [Eurytemora carolleeae]|uniref:uncharacterized protein LOC111711710 n=1 Tax=Eurytemora carolleeae TaxID=1294199 RepID=UPI000C79226F|nr:uncharacterized protein LOC111711710 [Eurytemora carolleeae]|eukprot:XP_023341897.1 uncharacterized protein LOC111711710 [Eurytemora affinis]
MPEFSLVSGFLLMNLVALAQPECCDVKNVTGSVDDVLDGVYYLNAVDDVKRMDICKDGCVYLKENVDDKLFCFMEVPIVEASDIDCKEITAEEVAELRQELEALEEVAKALLNIVEMLELLEQRVSSGRVRRDDVPAPTTCEDLTNYIEKIKTSKGVDALPYAIAMDTYFKGVVNEESPYISCESLKAEVKATVEKVEKAKKEVANKIPPEQKIPTTEPVDTTTAEPVDTTTAEPVDTTTAEPVDTTTAEPDDGVSNTTTAEPIDTTTDIFYLFEMPVKVVYTPSAFF